jgi:DNA replication and repair protein RecF
MHLQNISVINFKNYAEASLEFSDGVNCFTGLNGSGKTNLLDAIHYLCLCKSYFNPVDSQQILHDEPFFVVQGDFIKDGQKESVYCGFKRNHKKQFKRNGKEYDRLADHIGIFPLVMISPYDNNLVTEGSEERRKFLDSSISQVDAKYLDELVMYNKILSNRNALLKRFSETGKVDEEMIEVYDEQLTESGNKIYQKRKNFTEIFIPLFNKLYQTISSDSEQVSFTYESQLHQEDLSVLLKSSLRKDLILERTNSGIHKDDLIFMIGDHPLKKFGSQGQQKSYLIALKLAQYTFLKDAKGVKPLLLLDDIFDKLDDQRIKQLLEMVSHHDFGQLFITDTNKDRVAKIFEDIHVDCKIIEVEKGVVK